jgi:hypothetical protein
MQRLVRLAVIAGVVFAGACSNGRRTGFDTIGAGATPGEAGGAPLPATAAGSVAPTMTTTDTGKKAVKAADTAKKTQATKPRKPA